MKIGVGILLIIAVFCPVSIFAYTPLVIEDEKSSFHLSEHLDFFEDKSGSLTINDAMAFAKDGKFTASNTAVPNFGFTDSVYWLRFKMINPSHKEQTVFLEQGYPHIDYIELFVFNQGKQTAFFKGGDALPFSERKISYRNPLFSLELSPNSISQVFMRFKTESSMQIPLTIWRPIAFSEKASKEQVFLGFYLGIMAAMLFYNLFLWIVLWDKNYLYYILYIASFFLVQVSLHRFDAEFLWPDAPIVANLGHPVFWNMTFFFGAQFCRSFLETDKRAPFLDKILIAFMVISVIGVCLTFTFGYKAGLLSVVYVLGIFEPLVVFIAGVRCWYSGLTTARYFTMAWSVLILSAVIFNLKNIGALPSTTLIHFSLNIGAAVEVFLLSLALGDRINVIKAERLTAQQQAFKSQQSFATELESQIKIRTLELEDANKKLENLSNRDGLTGLYNRRYFDQSMKEEWNRLQRNGQSLCLIMTDIDFFKKFNDMYGHPAGDACIQTVAEILKKCGNRVSDVVARYGGEEFALILPNTESNGANEVADKIAILLKEKAIRHDASRVSEIVTLSIGVACVVPGQLSKPETLIEMADQALYQSKKGGRNKISII